jgi:hypothetical protein
MRKKISYLLKILVVICSLGGVTLSSVLSKRHGYGEWWRAFLYFTGQSNLWLGLSFLMLLIVPLISKSWYDKKSQVLYLFKYISTVCITVTFIVFSVFLAPFAPPEYYLFGVSSFLTHIFAPIFAITDFFVDDHPYNLNSKKALWTTVPPFFYTVVVISLVALKVDFGRGEPYPYYFFNIYSPAGLFGFSVIPPYFVGTFYWILGLALSVYFIARLYARLKTKVRKNA